MYYEAESVSDVLKCSFCSFKLVDTVKLLPDCGNSICGECYEALQDELKEAKEYVCKRCDRFHEMHSDGLKDNQLVLQLLRLQPREKPLSQGARDLRCSIVDLKDNIDKLQSEDDEEEVNVYCDSLELQVIEEVKSAMAELNEHQEDSLRTIKNFRMKLLGLDEPGDKMTSTESLDFPPISISPQPPSESVPRKELTDLMQRVDTFRAKWSSFFNQMSELVNEDQITQALSQMKLFVAEFKNLKFKLTNERFKGRILVLKTQELGKNFHLRFLDYAEYHKQVVGPELLHTLKGHIGIVTKVLFLPHEKLASCSRDITIMIWSLKTGEMLHELEGHHGWILSIEALKHDRLASSSADKTIKIWELETGACVCTVVAHSKSIFSLKILPSGHLASCGHDHKIKTWKLVSNECRPVQTMTSKEIRFYNFQLGYLSNGHLVTCSYDAVSEFKTYIKLWNPESGENFKSFLTNSRASSLEVLSNDNIAVGFQNGTIKILDHTIESVLRHLDDGSIMPVASLIELPDGTLASVNNYNYKIKIWNSETGRLIKTIPTQHTNSIFSLAATDDGRLLATGSADNSIEIISFW